jgi:hypothetical protein
MLGRLLFGAAIAAGVGYGYPLVSEHASGACQAVEMRFIAMASPPHPLHHPIRTVEYAVFRSYFEPFSSGAVAATAIKQQYPAIPAEAGCALAYWTSLIDPRVEHAVRKEMRNGE